MECQVFMCKPEVITPLCELGIRYTVLLDQTPKRIVLAIAKKDMNLDIQQIIGFYDYELNF